MPSALISNSLSSKTAQTLLSVVVIHGSSPPCFQQMKSVGALPLASIGPGCIPMPSAAHPAAQSLGAFSSSPFNRSGKSRSAGRLPASRSQQKVGIVQAWQSTKPLPAGQLGMASFVYKTCFPPHSEYTGSCPLRQLNRELKTLLVSLPHYRRNPDAAGAATRHPPPALGTPSSPLKL